MRITPVQNQNRMQKTQFANNTVSKPIYPQNNSVIARQFSSALTNDFYRSNLVHLDTSTYKPSFRGLELETKVVQKIVGKQFQGLGIYTPDKNFIDFLKIGYEKLSKEAIDIVKATDNEITAHRFSLALAETYSEGSDFGTSWVKRYNPENRNSPLAVSHSLTDSAVKEEVFAKNLEILYNPRRCKSLDIPITDKDGRICLDAVVFDTETTGTNTQTDKIVQMATVRLKNGKIVKGEGGTFNQLINPEMPIPEEASAVNGITDEMVKDAPNMSAVLDGFLGKHLNKENGAIVVYNSKFDIPLLNRTIREHNVSASQDLKEKQLAKVLDPYILIQRIHPFLGAKKKLGNQYHWLFCKPMEDAHDALSDVKGTIDVLKYCLYYLSKNRKDPSIPLTLREVLIFQNGGHGVENITLPLHPTKDFNALVKFDESYRPEPLDVTNYFKGYKLTKKIVNELTPEIGEANLLKLQQEGIVDEMVGTSYKGHPLQAAETERVPKAKQFKSISYVMRQNFKKVLGYANLEPYNGKSKEEIEDLITEKARCYLKEKIKEIWLKNVNPKDIKQGNDLPDDEITRLVMKEAQEG